MLRPLSDHLIVEPIAPPKETPGGIALPEMQRKHGQTQRGTVLAVGPGQKDSSVKGGRLPVDVKAGDTIVFLFGTSEVEIDRKKFLILKEADVLAILEK